MRAASGNFLKNDTGVFSNSLLGLRTEAGNKMRATRTTAVRAEIIPCCRLVRLDLHLAPTRALYYCLHNTRSRVLIGARNFGISLCAQSTTPKKENSRCCRGVIIVIIAVKRARRDNWLQLGSWRGRCWVTSVRKLRIFRQTWDRPYVNSTWVLLFDVSITFYISSPLLINTTPPPLSSVFPSCFSSLHSVVQAAL